MFKTTHCTSIKQHLWIFLWIIFALNSVIIGCDANVCLILDPNSCTKGQQCSIGTDGSPRCIESPSQPLSTGALCEQTDDCPKHHACVTLYQLPRCLPLCDIEGRAGQLSCDDHIAFDSSGNDLSRSNRCLYQLPNYADVGVCISACDPLSGTSDPNHFNQMTCPPSTPKYSISCQLDPYIGLSVCQGGSDRNEGELCGAGHLCKQGLHCAYEGKNQRCRPLSDQSGACPPFQLPIPVPLQQSDPTQQVYSTCHRCAPLRLSSIESELLLCFTPLVEPQNQCTNDASQCPCSEVNQDIANLDEYSLLQRKDLISLIKELYTNVKGTTIPQNLWVGAIAPPMNQQKQGWRWINGGLISEKDIDQTPRMRDFEQDAQCLSLSTDTGRYEVKNCSEKLPTLCTER